MKRVAAAGEVVSGYDVSHWQSDMSIHAKMKMAGKKFCIIKADEGATVSDKLFHAHWNEAKKQGMITSAYNFFHPKQDPHAQAKHFESIVGRMGPGDLGPCIDWESDDGTSHMENRESGFQFLLDVQQYTSKRAIIYGGPYFIEALKLDSRFSQFMFWNAHYTKNGLAPLVPDVFSTWQIWQWTESNGLDLNFWNGNEASLRKAAGL